MNALKTMCMLLSVLSIAAIGSANEISNPNFDTDLSGWDNPYARPAVWDSRDFADSPSSGSALLTEPDGNGAAFAILLQCLPVTEGAELEGSAQVYQSSGQSCGDGHGLFWYRYHDTTDCTGSQVGSLRFSSYSQVWDAWAETSINETVPAHAQSAEFYLAVICQDAGQSLSVHFDNVVVIVDSMAIFEDGFESSDLSGWSSSVP